MAESSHTVLDYDAPARTHTRRPSTWQPRLLRFGLVVAGLALWFLTQYLIGKKSFPANGIGDALFELVAPAHAYLLEHPASANALLITSSLLIDFLGLFIIAWSIFGPSIRPFVGLILLFGLRQLCQSLCSLPPPDGMIWRDPGFPSLLVTYGVSNDLFFSGHSALAVYGCVTLAQAARGRPRLRVPLAALGVAIALFQCVAVILLRAHYTMDVFAGAVTALLVVAFMHITARPTA